MIPHSRPTIGEEEIAAVSDVLRSGRLAQGAEIEAFEAECAALVGRGYGVAVNSGTAALHLALAAAGVRVGDAVALPSYACASLMTAVGLQEGRSVLCNVGDDFNLIPESVPTACGFTIVPHLFGAPARFPGHGAVIEDIAQSMGGPTGREGLATITSFYATKLMTTGEGGMVLCDDEGLADYVRDRRDYDNRDDFIQRFAYKMTDFQAAMGRVQLRRLSEFIARRREIAQRYEDGLNGYPLRLPAPEDHVFFRYVAATEERDALEGHLSACGIEAKRPVYRPAHHYLEGAFPGAQRAHEQALSLPIYPSLVDEEVDRVVESIQNFFAKREPACTG